MKVYLGTDHAGFRLKEKVKQFLLEKGYVVEDCGASEFSEEDDYPDFVSKAAQEVAKDPQSRGIVFGGSGLGEAMVANKTAGIRCAVFYTPAIPPHPIDIQGKTSEDPFAILRLTREHNDANMLSLAARFLTEEQAFQAVTVFLEEKFSGEERHVRRIEKMSKLEGEK